MRGVVLNLLGVDGVGSARGGAYSELGKTGTEASRFP